MQMPAILTCNVGTAIASSTKRVWASVSRDGRSGSARSWKRKRATGADQDERTKHGIEGLRFYESESQFVEVEQKHQREK